MEPTIDELRRWSAEELMGWHISDYTPDCYRDSKYPVRLVSSWLPDHPETGQIWLVVERMIQKGWRFGLWSNGPDEFGAEFYKGRTGNPTAGSGAFDPNPCLAILKAAHAAKGAKK